MKKRITPGLTKSSGTPIGSSHFFGSILTKTGKVYKDLQETVLSIENGKRIDGYVKIIPQYNKMGYVELYPKAFEKAIKVISYLGATVEHIDERPDTKTKGKYVIVKLTPEQEAELQKLKALCN